MRPNTGFTCSSRARSASMRVVRQRVADHLAERAQDLPVLARLAGRIDGEQATLHAAFGVDVGAVLFGVGGARQDHVGARGAGVAVMALIHHKRIGADARRVELVGAEQPQHIDAAIQHLRQRLAVGARHKAEIQRADARGRGVQHVEAVPLRRQRADRRGQPPAGGQHRRAIGPRQRGLADDDHRLLGVAQQPWRSRAIHRAARSARWAPAPSCCTR